MAILNGVPYKLLIGQGGHGGNAGTFYPGLFANTNNLGDLTLKPSFNPGIPNASIASAKGLSFDSMTDLRAFLRSQGQFLESGVFSATYTPDATEPETETRLDYTRWFDNDQPGPIDQQIEDIFTALGTSAAATALENQFAVISGAADPGLVTLPQPLDPNSFRVLLFASNFRVVETRTFTNTVLNDGFQASLDLREINGDSFYISAPLVEIMYYQVGGPDEPAQVSPPRTDENAPFAIPPGFRFPTDGSAPLDVETGQPVYPDAEVDFPILGTVPFGELQPFVLNATRLWGGPTTSVVNKFFTTIQATLANLVDKDQTSVIRGNINLNGHRLVNLQTFDADTKPQGLITRVE